MHNLALLFDEEISRLKIEAKRSKGMGKATLTFAVLDTAQCVETSSPVQVGKGLNQQRHIRIALARIQPATLNRLKYGSTVLNNSNLVHLQSSELCEEGNSNRLS